MHKKTLQYVKFLTISLFLLTSCVSGCTTVKVLVDKKEEIKVLYFTKNQIKKLIKDNKILHQPHIGLFYTAIVNKLIK